MINLTKSQTELITAPTPAEHIKKLDKGNGVALDYVSVGYVQDVLNNAFAYNWDFVIIDQVVGKTQVYVRGELKVYAGDGGAIVKQQYGGSRIKTTKSGAVLSIGDDLKSAASDSLKKCASMLGIAQDVYSPDLIEGERIVDAPLAKAHKELGGQVIEGKNEKTTTTKSPGGPDVPCPICQSPMVEREAKKGDNKGKFWGCSKYPECKGSRDHNWTQEIEKDAENRINIKSAADDTHAEEIPTEDIPF